MSIDTECYEKVGLFFSARGLPKMDITSNTDPFCIVYVTDPKTQQQLLLGHTSVIQDTNNPDWPDQLVMDYHFEAIQKVTVKCFDQDGGANPMDLSKHETCGEISFPLSDLMCSRGQKLTLPLVVKGKSFGNLTVRGEAVTSTRDVFLCTFKAIKMHNKGPFWQTSDPFIVISRIYEDGTYGVVWKNNPIMNNLSPTFSPARIPLMKLCNGDIDRPLRVEFMDYNDDGNHKTMGVVATSVRAMMDSKGLPMNIIKEKHLKEKGYTNSGTMSAVNCSIERHPSFSDFIFGGCEVSLVVGIDFTGSNGDPRSSDSLHYISRIPNQLNEYQQAILNVGRVVEQYDSDKLFPVYGFGAKVKQANGQFSIVQHCFPVYGGGLEVQGVDGILQAYSDCLNAVALSGPTLFAPIIDAATAIAANSNVSQQNQKYTILVIIADGVINDMDATVKAIIKASEYPLSIIIIGVGAADFSAMNVLDGDNALLKSGLQSAKRDIVQFVPFRETAAKGIICLAEEVLKEVPGQVLEYFKMKNIQPNPPRQEISAI